QSRGSIEERRLHESCKGRESGGRSTRPIFCPAKLSRRTRRGIHSHHHIGIEHCEQSLEITRAQRGKECINHNSLALEIRVGCYLTAAHSSTGATGQLSRRIWCAIHDRCNLLERQVEHIV